MTKQLKDNKCWEYPPIQTIKEEDMNEGSDDDDHDNDDDVQTKTGEAVRIITVSHRPFSIQNIAMAVHIHVSVYADKTVDRFCNVNMFIYTVL